MPNQVEYIIVGAGPSALCAIAKLLGKGISGKSIYWIDPEFRVGDFGTHFSRGTGVPGNTKIAEFQKVNYAIYDLVPETAPKHAQLNKYAITEMPFDQTCHLQVAAAPMQHISNILREQVHSLEGMVTSIASTQEGFIVQVKTALGSSAMLTAKRVILAIGALPKSLEEHYPSLIFLDPTIGFIQSEANVFLQQNPAVNKIAVIGSSHSAALAVMHFLKAGVKVKQFMNKPYKFATPAIASDGSCYTQHDNTGLKGEVAAFTKALLEEKKYADQWECFCDANVDALLQQHLSDCTYAIAAIGYQARNTIHVNGLPLSQLVFNHETTEFTDVPGLFGIGIAFPQRKISPDGEIEFAVGYAKFWNTVNDQSVIKKWTQSVFN